MLDTVRGVLRRIERKAVVLWARSAMMASQSAERSGILPAAIRRASDALWIFEKYDEKPGAAVALLRLAHLYLQSLNWQEAREWARLAAALAVVVKNADIERQACYIYGTASCADGNLSEGLRFFERSLRLAIDLGRKDEEPVTLFMLALNSMRLGLKSDALDYVSRSIAASEAVNDSLRLSQDWLLLGHLNIDNRDELIRCGQKALQFARVGGDTENLYGVLLQLGKMLVMSGETGRASLYIEEALAMENRPAGSVYRQNEAEALSMLHCSRGDFSGAIEKMAEVVGLARQGNLPIEQARALCQLARFHQQIGQDREAEMAWREAMAIQESLWAALGSDDTLRVASGETFEIVYPELLGLLVLQGRAEEALELSERLRAQAFARLLHAEGSEGSATGLSISEIKAFAHQTQSTIVEYTIIVDFAGDRGEWIRSDSAALAVCVVSPSGAVNAVRIDLRPFLEQGIPLPSEVAAHSSRVPGQEFREIEPASGNSRPFVIDELLARWHEFFIAPIVPWLPAEPDPTVLFVPHLWLFSVPFPALLAPDGKALIDRFTIMTAPSIRVLSLLHERQKSAPAISKGALVAGNPRMPILPSGSILRPLPGAEAEARCVAETLGTKALLGADATKARIMAEAPGCRTIHLATHGILGNDAASGAIALAMGDGDGLLRSEEIMRLKLNADLVVLSACHTGGGRIMPDGVIGLSRAFLAAGSSTVLVSLREIPDLYTPRLMSIFYEHYIRTGDKAAALREAMLGVREIARDPLVWASFTLIGERKDLSRSTPTKSISSFAG